MLGNGSLIPLRKADVFAKSDEFLLIPDELATLLMCSKRVFARSISAIEQPTIKNKLADSRKNDFLLSIKPIVTPPILIKAASVEVIISLVKFKFSDDNARSMGLLH